MYEIVLSDGTKIKDIELNGNNYIPKEPINASVFEGKTDTLKVIGSNGVIEVFENFKVIFASVLGKQSFIIQEKNKEEIEKEALYQLLADLTETVLMGGGIG